MGYREFLRIVLILLSSLWENNSIGYKYREGSLRKKLNPMATMSEQFVYVERRGSH